MADPALSNDVAKSPAPIAPAAPVAAIPGKRTLAPALARAGGGGGVAAVIEHAGQSVVDALGFTYLVRPDGAFVVTATPQQLVRAIGTVITPDGRLAARWQAVAAQLLATPAAGPPAPGPATAPAQPRAGDEAVAADWFRGRWRAATAGRGLAGRLHAYATTVDVLRLRQLAIDALQLAPQVVAAGFDRFADEVEAELIEALGASPEAAAIWREFVEAHLGPLAQRDRLARFRQRAERGLLDRIADGAGAPGSAGRELVDVHVREIVANHRQDFFTSASNGVHLWRMPVADASAWPSIVSGASSLAGGVGSILTTSALAGAAIAGAGIPLLVAGIGAGLYAAVLSYQGAEEAARSARVEAAIKEETLRGFERIASGVAAQEDVIAALVTTAAIAHGIDVRSLARGPLRAFAWREMFGAVPADLAALRVHVTATMHRQLDHHLGG